MRPIFLTILLFIGIASFAQKEEIKVEKQGNLYCVTVFHDNGEVAQKGFVTPDKKLHGIWKSFDERGQRKSIGYYFNGKKTGKWIFWNSASKIISEVNFGKNNNQTKNIGQWRQNTQLADVENDDE